MISFFGVINISAPHIYHSALLLSPKLSTVSTLYKQYGHPSVKVFQGLPTSWDHAIAAVYPNNPIIAFAWSPCGKFIAFSQMGSEKIEVVDATTLGRVKTFTSPPVGVQQLCFSPDGHLLTGLNDEFELISWDFQTGGLVSTVSSERDERKGHCISSIYSIDGTVVAVAYDFYSDNSTAISTYNLTSETQIYSHCPLKGRIVAPVWAHNEHLQFCTVKPGSITLWEVRFTSIDTLVEIKSLPVPDGASDSTHLLFLPTLSHLAFTLQQAVQVWDAQSSRLLLNFEGQSEVTEMKFSPNGQFFACGTLVTGLLIWRASSTGYTFHQKVTSQTFLGAFGLSFSPNEGSLIVCNPWGMQICDTTPSFSNNPMCSNSHFNFALALSPDKSFAAVARRDGKKITVSNLEGSGQLLSIDISINIDCLGVTGRTIVGVGEGKVFTWNVPTGGCGPNAEANINIGIQTIEYDCQVFDSIFSPSSRVSISPNCNYIACMVDERGSMALNIYDVSTGRLLTGTALVQFSLMWFTQDNLEVWCMGRNELCGWTIIEGDRPGHIKLDPIGPGVLPSGGFPWQSSHGYKVTLDGWVLSPSKKRLLWLPHSWRSGEKGRKWDGQFLGLIHSSLPEAVILEFYE